MSPVSPIWRIIASCRSNISRPGFFVPQGSTPVAEPVAARHTYSNTPAIARPIDMSIDETEAPSDTSYTHGPPADEAGGVLTIDLSAIEANWRKLRSLSTPAECGAV